MAQNTAPQPQPQPQPDTTSAQAKAEAQKWVRILARYREPSTGRSLTEVAVTLLPFLAIWALAW